MNSQINKVKKSKEKLISKLIAICLSVGIGSMLLILFLYGDHYETLTWAALIFANAGLIILNVIYINLVENASKKPEL